MVALAVGVVLAALGVRDFYALICFILCAFVGLTILTEFVKGARLLQRKQETGFVPALVELTHRNTRRYGGYVVHMGIVFMFIGFAGSAFNEHGKGEVPVGDGLQVGEYEFHLAEITEENNANYASHTAHVELYRDGELLEVMMPERRSYHASGTGTTEVAIRPRIGEDVYVVFSGISTVTGTPVIEVYVNPLVNWIWIGAFVLVFGTLIALVPAKIKPIRTRIVGTTKKTHAVTTTTT